MNDGIVIIFKNKWKFKNFWNIFKCYNALKPGYNFYDEN